MIGEEGYRNGILLKSNKFSHNGGVTPALLVSAYVKNRRIISGRTAGVAFVPFNSCRRSLQVGGREGKKVIVKGSRLVYINKIS